MALATIPHVSTAAEPYDINVIIPLTGGAAFLGKSERVSLGIAEDILNKSGGINGRPVHFAIQDDQSSPQLAVQLLNGVLANHVPIVLGSTLTAICGAMAPLVKDGPVMWCFSNAYHPAPDGWIFVSGVSTDETMFAAARFARLKGWRRTALLVSNDASGLDAEHAYNEAMGFPENAGQVVVAGEHFNPTDISVAAQAARIKAANPQAVFAMTSGTAFGTILLGLQGAGIDVPVMSPSSNESYAQMTQYASFLPKELYFASVPTMSPDVLPKGAVRGAIDACDEAFRTRGVQPDAGSNQPSDAAFIIVNALRKLGTDVIPVQLRNYLDHLRGFMGADGEYDFEAFPKHGVGSNWTVIQRWDPVKASFVGASKPGGVPL